jgi:hypothetical protein
MLLASVRSGPAGRFVRRKHFAVCNSGSFFESPSSSLRIGSIRFVAIADSGTSPLFRADLTIAFTENGASRTAR